VIYDFQPGDGTRYNLVTVDDPHGGVLVICNNKSLWRYHAGDMLKFLCGNDNEYTRRAIWNHLEAEDKREVEKESRRIDEWDVERAQRNLEYYFAAGGKNDAFDD